ncbi:MAG: hypothetical protein ACYDDF_05055 [Thermoplasmatota archaeon]
MRTTKEGPHKAKIFWQKSQRFATAARSATEPDPIVSLAINAIINLADALCVQHAGERSAGDNHHDALKILARLETLDAKTRDAVGKRLAALLSMKSLAQYEGELLTTKHAKDAIQDMDRAFSAVTDIAKQNGWA